MTKKKLRRTIDMLLDDKGRCETRVLHLEAGIREFLTAQKAGEMGNRDKAIERLEHLVGAA